MKILIALLMFCATAQAQTTILPPQPNYSQYGSYSRQLRVYEATQQRQAAINRQNYRKLRNEIRRNLPRERTRIVITRNNYCSSGYDRWAERRRCTYRDRREW